MRGLHGKVFAQSICPKKRQVNHLRFPLLFRRTLKTTQNTCNFLNTTKIYIQQKSNLIWNTFQTILVNTNTLHLSVCVCCTDRPQMTPQRVKNKKVRHETKSSGVTVVLYTLWRLLWSITVHTHGKMYSICFIQ